MIVKLIAVSVAAVIGAHALADEQAICPLLDDDVAAIKTFFKDFMEAFNAKDVERVKRMSGDTWNHWAKSMNEGRFESVEILAITTENQTNVTTRCIAIDDKKRVYPARVVFTVKQEAGVYSIEKMRFPDSERRSKELDNGIHAVEGLIESINRRDLDSVKGLVSFGDVGDFETELSARGLSWVKDTIDNCIRVPRVNISASRDGNDVITCRLNVPSPTGGTNITRKVVLKGGKVDRAAGCGECDDVISKRQEQEKAEGAAALGKCYRGES